ncbi:efflux RND transporter periplasmic adaptor subunit [Lacibacterium aquatile]
MRNRLACSLIALTAVGLAACSEPEAQKVEDIRPVRAEKVTFHEQTRSLSLAGIVSARIESPLAFQVAGKIIERSVDAGARVKAGQVIARIDPEDYRLRVREAQAQVASAEADLARAKADLDRYAKLKSSQVFVQAVYDQRLATANVAASTVQRARSSLKIAENQLGYTDLLASAAGVVTGVLAEPGQVVQAGQSVVRVAQEGGLEVTVGVPENRVEEIRAKGGAQVSLWAEPDKEWPATLRELSPSADAATRTYAAKFALENPPAYAQIGMTATLSLKQQLPKPLARLPLSAIFQKGPQPAVWIVDVASGKVTLTPVEVAAFREDGAWISSGLTEGQTVVTAGVNKIDPAQKVRLMDASKLVGEAPAK